MRIMTICAALLLGVLPFYGEAIEYRAEGPHAGVGRDKRPAVL